MSDVTISGDAIIRRVYAKGIWQLKSPAHFGGSDTGLADMCLLRDENGHLFIPGASIAGAGRHYLSRLSSSWLDYARGKEPTYIKWLLGGSEKQDHMSALDVRDADCVTKHGETVRDGVRIEGTSGIAADTAKFDIEVVERGAEFQLQLACVIRSDDQKNGRESGILDAFQTLLYGFQCGDISLGARTSRGYGHGNVKVWDIRDLHMHDEADVLSYLKGDVWTRPEAALKAEKKLPDCRSFFQMEAQFRLKTSLLVRSPSEQPDAPDVVHLTSAGDPAMPGTSLTGVLRHRAGLIAQTLNWQNCEYRLADMFGPVHEGDRNAGRGKGLWASRVRVQETLVSDVKPRNQQRVAIDRFTGGALDAALFEERPVFPEPGTAHVVLNLRLEEPEDAEIGLLLLALRDLWRGDAPIGGEVSNGRGALQGVFATLKLKREGQKAMAYSLAEKDGVIEISNDKDHLLAFVKTAQQAPLSVRGSRKPQKGKNHETPDRTQ